MNYQNHYQMNQNQLIPAQYRSCFKCRYEAVTAELRCPRCRKPLYSATNLRWRGAVLVVLGLFLTVFMGAIAIFVTGLLMSAAKNPDSAAKMNREAHMLVIIYVIFGAVIAMGVTITLAGLWQIAFGRRNMFLIWIFFALLILTLVIGALFRNLT